jgi:glycosyltransferase involved in cell wall biosynthesis
MTSKPKVFMCSVFAEALYKSRRELIIEFITLGYEVILAAPESVKILSKEFPGMSVKYYQINLQRTGLNPMNDFKVIGELREIIKKEKPEITYAFGGAKAAIYTTIAASKEKVLNNFCMINGLGSIFRGKGLKNYLIRVIMGFLFKYSLAKSKGVLFQNPDDLNEFSKNGLVDSKKCIIVNGSGVNLERFPFSPIKSNNIFLFIGRLLIDKGIYEFVETARIIKEKYPDSEFWILGGYDTNPTGVKENEMQSWVDEGIIKYFGRQSNVLYYYQSCTAFILPSYHEGTPRTSLEAMAVGRPIITTDAPGCRETVIDGHNGFMVPVKNSNSIAEKVEYFINNRQAIQSMGINAFKFVTDKYDVNKVNKSIINFLSKRFLK